MNAMLNYIVWDPDQIIFNLGSFQVRYYSMMWLIGLAAAFLIVKKCFKDRNIPEETFDPLFIYAFIGILIGARLGHCIFYEPGYYLSSKEHFIEMLLPIDFTAKGVKLVGYRGLASHGGVIGVLTGVWLYCRKYKMSFLEVMDMIGVAAGITAACIRIGNLINSEIIGKPTGTDHGFVFKQLGEDFPRHPAQLYEAIAYLTLFIIILLIYRKRKDLVGHGFYFGLCLAGCFLFRFFVEFAKEVQSPWEEGLPLDQGQLLSIPLVIIGLYFAVQGYRKTTAVK